MCQKGPLHYLLQIRDVRLRGGDVIVSFGGAAGQELANEDGAFEERFGLEPRTEKEDGQAGDQLLGCGMIPDRDDVPYVVSARPPEAGMLLSQAIGGWPGSIVDDFGRSVDSDRVHSVAVAHLLHLHQVLVRGPHGQ